MVGYWNKPEQTAAAFDEDGFFQAVVDRLNDSLARFEQVRRFSVLPVVLSIESGHLTPTLKVKRRVVETEFSGLIDGMYSA